MDAVIDLTENPDAEQIKYWRNTLILEGFLETHTP
jgi:hypothetical protein